MRTKQRDKDENKCLELFQNYFGDRFGKMFIPNNKKSKIDLITDDGDQMIIWELKHTDKYYIDSFRQEGAMIDVSKFKHLRKLTNKNTVMYCRFYNDGYAVWHINSLQRGEYKYSTEFVRKRVTRSNSKATKSDCILLDFDAAIHIKQEEMLFNDVVKKRLQKFYN